MGIGHLGACTLNSTLSAPWRSEGAALEVTSEGNLPSVLPDGRKPSVRSTEVWSKCLRAGCGAGLSPGRRCCSPSSSSSLAHPWQATDAGPSTLPAGAQSSTQAEACSRGCKSVCTDNAVHGPERRENWTVTRGLRDKARCPLVIHHSHGLSRTRTLPGRAHGCKVLRTPGLQHPAGGGSGVAESWAPASPTVSVARARWGRGIAAASRFDFRLRNGSVPPL